MNAKEHIRLAEERMKWATRAKEEGDYSVMADLSFKAAEQAVCAYMARINPRHNERHEDVVAFVNAQYSKDAVDRFADLWRLYRELGYGGRVTFGKPERAYNHMLAIVSFVGEKIGHSFTAERSA